MHTSLSEVQISLLNELLEIMHNKKKLDTRISFCLLFRSNKKKEKKHIVEIILPIYFKNLRKWLYANKQIFFKKIIKKNIIIFYQIII